MRGSCRGAPTLSNVPRWTVFAECASGLLVEGVLERGPRGFGGESEFDNQTTIPATRPSPHHAQRVRLAIPILVVEQVEIGRSFKALLQCHLGSSSDDSPLSSGANGDDTTHIRPVLPSRNQTICAKMRIPPTQRRKKNQRPHQASS